MDTLTLNRLCRESTLTIRTGSVVEGGVQRYAYSLVDEETGEVHVRDQPFGVCRTALESRVLRGLEAGRQEG